MDKEIQDPLHFKEFYQFTFNFAKNPGQKGLGLVQWMECRQYCVTVFVVSDLEMAIAYWNLVLAGRFKFLDLWCEYLRVSAHIVHLSLSALYPSPSLPPSEALQTSYSQRHMEPPAGVQ